MAIFNSLSRKPLLWCGALILGLCSAPTGYRYSVLQVHERVAAETDPTYESQFTPVTHLAQLIRAYPNARRFSVRWQWGRPANDFRRSEAIFYDASRKIVGEECIGEPCPMCDPIFADVSKADIVRGAEQGKRVRDLGRQVPCNSLEYKRDGGD